MRASLAAKWVGIGLGARIYGLNESSPMCAARWSLQATRSSIEAGARGMTIARLVRVGLGGAEVYDRSGRADMVEESARERRNSGRFNAAAFLWYRIVGEGAEADEVQDGNLAACLDLSATGVGFQSTRPIAAGAWIFLVVATRGGELAAVGKIAHCRAVDDGQFRVGVRFEIIPPTHRPILERLVKQ